MDPVEVGEKLTRYLAQQWRQVVSLEHIEKIFGGASRETYRLRVVVGESPRNLILRRDPPSSLIDTERYLEYGAYKAVYGTAIPVPEPLFLENDGSWLGQPFSVMAAVDDAVSDVSQLTTAQQDRIGRQKWSILGTLATMDPIALGFDEFLTIPTVESAAMRELDYWEQVIVTDALNPQPVAAAAIRWLRANPPLPAQRLSIVHGDFRSGNFLFAAEAGIKAILDWEMCHVGDPLEDLAWSLDPLWCWGQPELAGRLLPHQEAIKCWEQASGLTLDVKNFRWWRVFASIKAIAIWISSSEDFENGVGKDSILAMAGWVMTDRQNQILLDYLSPHSEHRLTGGVL